MRDSWAKIPGGVDSIPRRPTQRQPDREHEKTNNQRDYADREYRGQVLISKVLRIRDNRYHAEDQHGGGDHLGDEVGGGVADLWDGREYAQLDNRIVGLLPVLEVNKVTEDRPGEGAE